LTWFLIFLAIVAIGGVTIYNSLVKLRTHAHGAWADIDVQLKRRYDLIPNLVETVKGYASHEKESRERHARGSDQRQEPGHVRDRTCR